MWSDLGSENGQTWKRLDSTVDYSVPCPMDERWAGLLEPQSRLCQVGDYGIAGGDVPARM